MGIQRACISWTKDSFFILSSNLKHVHPQGRLKWYLKNVLGLICIRAKMCFFSHSPLK